MPASRSARAITLAPRSCPSSPGLATRTRILGSLIVIHLTTGGKSPHRVPRDLPLEGLGIKALPQIPASDAAIRLPALCDFLHLLWARQLDLPLASLLSRRGLLPCLGPLHVEIMLMHCHADAEITGWQYIFALQREHKKHLRRPHADALHLG